MNTLERQEFILNLLKKKDVVKTSEISSTLKISRETIRKDIYTLEKKGKLLAVRGGATTLDQNITETRYRQRTSENIQEKKYIANLALKFIKDGDTIFLDNGTTIVELAKKINSSNLNNITVITDSINVLDVFRYNEKFQIILLGGGLRHSESSLSGPIALENIRNLYCNIIFCGCGGISSKIGITNHYFAEVEVTKKMIRHSSKVIVLADHSKFEKNALYKTADISEIDTIITDKNIDAETLSKFKQIIHS